MTSHRENRPTVREYNMKCKCKRNDNIFLTNREIGKVRTGDVIVSNYCPRCDKITQKEIDI